MDILLNIDAVTSQHNLKDLRHLYDLVESHVQSLKLLGVSPDAYGTLLSSVLLNKLPPEIRLIANRTVGEDSRSLDALLKVVEEEFRAREPFVANPPAQPRKTTTRDHWTNLQLLRPTSCVTPLWNGEASRGFTSYSPTSWKMVYMPEQGSHIPELSHYLKMYNLQGSTSCEHLFKECSSK